MATITREEQARLQRERVERALIEDAFEFVMDSSGEFAHCFSKQSAKFYKVSEQECNCKDFQFRCASRSLACKHMVAFIARQEAG